MSIGEAIRYYRKQRGWTQGQLAALAGYSQSSLTYYERNRHDPRISVLVAIADALEVPVCALLGGHPPDTRRSATRPRGRSWG